ncbi:MAG TPA: dipeptide ABC transporter ATP-binding protein [Sulfurovum sp.]|uniref:ABC transporter ATP-binding protein n=1 Tax=Sulfurovum sp. TaxID=1969726 RepID=UPI002F91C044
MSSILTVKALSLSVGSEIVLDRVSFDIQRGEIFALVGESGSGKSLTSLAIMRLLPEAIAVRSGEIHLKERALFTLPESQMQKVRGRSVAMIFQEPMSALNPVMTVGSQVAEVLKQHLGLKKEQIREKVLSLFREVALEDPEERYHWYPHQLSGGQKQRVMIAIALACEPDLLIADEPTTALDVTIQAQVLGLLKKICKQRDLSILFITHDMAVVSEMADRVAVMKKGEIVEQAACKDFFTHPQHAYSKRLLGDARSTKVYSQAEEVSEPLIEVEGLKVHFPIKKGFFQRTTGYVRAVDDVTFSIAKGKTLALVGESGSGKSTIGKAILSLLDETEGEVRFQKQNLVGLDKKALSPYRRKIQVVFQDPFSSLNPRMTIANIIREGMISLEVGPKSRREQDRYIEALLLKVDLEAGHMHRYPHEFSGGQRQRIGIARALAVEPELIICDEPTSALDASVRTQVLDLLARLQKESGVSYLFITHDLSIVPRIADEVAVMKKGKIVEQGLVKEVMEDPQHPYTQKLLASAPKLLYKERESDRSI